ncbi:hypothetical protein RGUI_1462 [Rhodovulum sp. P5]|nr:hypothetical protein RGUI_1462 [Rhodovulum sp. P5]
MGNGRTGRGRIGFPTVDRAVGMAFSPVRCNGPPLTDRITMRSLAQRSGASDGSEKGSRCNTGAAPATVSGEPLPRCHRFRPGRRANRPRPAKPGNLPDRRRPNPGRRARRQGGMRAPGTRPCRLSCAH